MKVLVLSGAIPGTFTFNFKMQQHIFLPGGEAPTFQRYLKCGATNVSCEKLT